MPASECSVFTLSTSSHSGVRSQARSQACQALSRTCLSCDLPFSEQVAKEVAVDAAKAVAKEKDKEAVVEEGEAPKRPAATKVEAMEASGCCTPRGK